MSRTTEDVKFRERNIMFSRRQNFKHAAAQQWLSKNMPGVWQAIEAEANKRFPLLNKCRQRARHDYSFLNKVKP